MRHFSTRKEANNFKVQGNKKLGFPSLLVFKKIKGHNNRIKKPFVVGNTIEWLNLN